MSSSTSAGHSASRGVSRHGKPLALFTLGRALLSAESALDFSAEEADEACGLLRALLALLAAGPAAGALSLLLPAAEGAWWPFFAALALVNLAALALVRWRLQLDDELLPLPRVVFGEAGGAVVASLFLSWVLTYNAGLALGIGGATARR